MGKPGTVVSSLFFRLLHPGVVSGLLPELVAPELPAKSAPLRLAEGDKVLVRAFAVTGSLFGVMLGPKDSPKMGQN